MNPISKIYRLLQEFKKSVDLASQYKDWHYKSPKVNHGKFLATYINNHIHPKKIAEIEFQVFSQFGDDGIIQWLISQIPIPNKTFIEFGVEDYKESNTRFLLINNYWSGLVIDGNPKNIKSIQSEQIYTFYDLQAECSFITRSNINELIASAKFKEEVGVLSIDIDGNDYWIWKAITNINPIIVICEYNSLFGFEHPYTINYEDDFVRGKNFPFNFYGSSLKSLFDLAEVKGYCFVGSNSAGNNAYFIRKDYVQYVNLPVLSVEEGYVFASFTEAWNNQGIPVRGLEKIKTIDTLPVFNTHTQSTEKISAENIIQSLLKTNKISRF